MEAGSATEGSRRRVHQVQEVSHHHSGLAHYLPLHILGVYIMQDNMVLEGGGGAAAGGRNEK